MESRIRSVSRLLPFGVTVVWDALTDPVLLQGWLAPEVRPLVGQTLAIALDAVPLPGASAAIMRSIEPGRAAELDLGAAGTVRFDVVEAEPFASGRGASTCTATASPAHDLADRGLVAALDARLEALHELLRGRPVDWVAASTGDVTLPGVQDRDTGVPGDGRAPWRGTDG